MTLSAEIVREIFDYDKTTGVFTWRIKPSINRKAGDVAGGVNSDGYRKLKYKGNCVGAHRVAWLYVYGRWPYGEIDHINQDKLDNRIENLRDTTTRGNAHNKPGWYGRELPRGVYQIKSSKANPYRSMIRSDGKLIHIGLYHNPEDAHAAYIKAKGLYHDIPTWGAYERCR